MKKAVLAVNGRCGCFLLYIQCIWKKLRDISFKKYYNSRDNILTE